MTHSFPTRRSSDLFARRHPLFEIGGEDIVVRLLEDGAEAPLAFLERGFGVLSFGDVERDAQQPRALLAAIAEAAAMALQPPLLARVGAEDAIFDVERHALRQAQIDRAACKFDILGVDPPDPVDRKSAV